MALKANALISLANLKACIDVGSATDAQLEQMIDAISEFIQNYIGRAIIIESFTNERHDKEYLGDSINLLNFPVTTLTEIRYDADNDDEGTAFTTDDYRIKLKQGIVCLPQMECSVCDYYSVDYSAGLAETVADVPSDLQMAVCSMAKNMLTNLGGLKSETMGSYSYTQGDLIGGVTPQVYAILEGYK